MTTTPKPQAKQAELTDKAPAVTSAPQDRATSTAVAAHPSNAAPAKQSPVLALARWLEFADAASFAATLKATIMPGSSTDAQVAMLCSVALAHKLNPLKREIYAFPDRGGIRPIISIDGWYTIANGRPEFNGIEFEFGGQCEGKGKGSLWCKATVYRKDRDRPTIVTEFYDECYRNTEPWNGMPRRQLRHKAAIQCVRVAFGLAGMMDEDEYERMVEMEKARPRAAPGAVHGPARTSADATAALAARAEARKAGATANAQGSAAQSATEPEDVEFVAHENGEGQRIEADPETGEIAVAPDPADEFPPYPADAIDTTTRG